MSDEYQDIVRAGIPLADDAQEGSLRPQFLKEFLGQEEIKKNLSVFIQAARDREEAVRYVDELFEQYRPYKVWYWVSPRDMEPYVMEYVKDKLRNSR